MANKYDMLFNYIMYFILIIFGEFVVYSVYITGSLVATLWMQLFVIVILFYGYISLSKFKK